MHTTCSVVDGRKWMLFDMGGWARGHALVGHSEQTGGGTGVGGGVGHWWWQH